MTWGIVTRLTAFVALSDEQTVDPRQPTRRFTVPHELPAGMSAEGLGLRRSSAHVMARGARVPTVDDACVSTTLFHRSPPSPKKGKTLFAPSPNACPPPTPPDLPSRPRYSPPTSLRIRAERVRAHDGTLRLQFTLLAPHNWQLAPTLTVLLDDGTTTELEVVFEHTTTDGEYEAGETLRLVLRGEQEVLEEVLLIETNSLQILVRSA